MKEEVQSVLGKAVVHVGQGSNVMDDRVYIKVGRCSPQTRALTKG